MIYILYSGDYELYFGRNLYSEKEVLIDPTDKLLNICSAHNIPLTIFVDTLCFLRYKKITNSRFPLLVEKQLRSAIVDKHDIQLHIHPHWEKAEFKNDQWKYSNKDFLLGMIDHDPEKIRNITNALIVKSKKYLHDIGKSVDPDYECIAFRAGNYGFQPKTELIIDILIKNNIKIDSSIVPGLVMNNEVNQIDFRNVPQTPNYYLSPQYGLRKASHSGIFEIPIASYLEKKIIEVCSRIKFKLNKIIHYNSYRSSNRGISIQMNNQRSNKLVSFIRFQLQQFKRQFYPLELYDNPYLMYNITKGYISQFNQDEDIFFSLNCHPKSINSSRIASLIKYNQMLLEEFGSNIRSITFGEAEKILRNKL